MTPLSPDVVGFWAVVPPLVAIVLAIVTRNVIPSLVIGIFSGAAIRTVFTDGSALDAVRTFLSLVANKIAANSTLVLFFSLLGALIAVITASGGSRAYGEWARRRLRDGRSASLVTALLCSILFIDDYFVCLTVGPIMRPVTDIFRISREKLAYLVDAMAAPLCILAPISSWSATVISCFPKDCGVSPMSEFLRTLPLNFYAWLTIGSVIWFSCRKGADFGAMAQAEKRARESGSEVGVAEATENLPVLGKGRVLDLVLPIVALIGVSLLAMLHYGGYWTERRSVIEALSATDAEAAIALGTLSSLVVAFLLVVPRRVLTFGQFFESTVRGVKSMTSALIILSLAWSISGVCRDLLGTGPVVAGWVKASAFPIAFLPALFFLVGAALAFSTGTSWGTFGILIPILVEICAAVDPSSLTLVLAAMLAGAVLGDHCSPISDTTILSSAGAQCSHIAHVSTQLPYALFAGSAAFLGYLVAGFVHPFGDLWAGLAGFAVGAPLLFFVYSRLQKEHSK